MSSHATLKATTPTAAQDGGVRTPAPRANSASVAALQAQPQALPRSGASQLPQPLRSEMSARFGEGLEAVRLHRGAQAEKSAEALAAKAYTRGNDIVIGAAAPPLDTHAGRRVLAHEVAHVVQQRRGGPPPALTPEAPHEHSAQRAAQAYASGAPSIDVSGGTSIGVAREPDDKPPKKKSSTKQKSKGKPPKQAEAGSPAKEAKKASQHARRVDPDIDADVERSIVEEEEDQPAPKAPKPAKRKSNKSAKDARKEFSKGRDKQAKALSVGKGGQVHHGVEIQVLKRYPGVFSKDEINDPSNMRGIKPENEGKRQLHNSKIRESWDRHYIKLDGLIKQNGLKKGSPEYNKFVKQYLLEARAEMDHNYGQFYSEQWAQQTGKVAEASSGSKKKKEGKKTAAKKSKTSAKAPAKAAGATSATPSSKKSAPTSGKTKKPSAKAVDAAGSNKKGGAAAASAPKKQTSAAADKADAAKKQESAPAAPKPKKAATPAKKATSKAGAKVKTSTATGSAGKNAAPSAAKQAATTSKKAPKADIKQAPAAGATSQKTPAFKSPPPAAEPSVAAKPAASKPAVRTALPKATSGAASSTRTSSKPSLRAGTPPSVPGRASVSGRAFSTRFSGASGYRSAAASGLAAIAMPFVNHYLQKHFADKVQEEAQLKISEAIEARRGDIEAAVEARRQEIETAQAQGKRVRVNVVVDTTWQDTTDPESGVNVYGSVLMNAKVAKFEILHEDERPSPYTRKKKGGILGDLIRAGVGNEQTFERFDIELEGTNEEMRAFNARMRAIEKAQGNPPVRYEHLIIRALAGELPAQSVREYAAYQRELAEQSAAPGVCDERTGYWQHMEALMDGSLDQLIAKAKEKGVSLDQLRAYAEANRAMAGVLSHVVDVPYGEDYWSEMIRLIDGR